MAGARVRSKGKGGPNVHRWAGPLRRRGPGAAQPEAPAFAPCSPAAAPLLPAVITMNALCHKMTRRAQRFMKTYAGSGGLADAQPWPGVGPLRHTHRRRGARPNRGHGRCAPCCRCRCCCCGNVAARSFQRQCDWLARRVLPHTCQCGRNAAPAGTASARALPCRHAHYCELCLLPPPLLCQA